MPYRDDREYLRARIFELETELAAAREEIADLHETGRLRVRVFELEDELARARTEMARLRGMTLENARAVMQRLMDETRALEREREELRRRVKELENRFSGE